MSTVNQKKSDSSLFDKDKNENVVICTELRLGEWKEKVPFDKRQVIIANALNLCLASKNGFKVLGYLIARRRVLLVLESKMLYIEKQLISFDTIVKDSVKEYLNKSTQEPTRKTNVVKMENKAKDRVFYAYPLYNNPVFHLITGQTFHLDYYSPYLRRLKEMLRDYPFCSIKNYHCLHAGNKSTSCMGVTAVKVKLMPRNFWQNSLIKLKKWDQQGWVRYDIKTK